MNSATIVQKLWNYCNVLRDDGMSYGDYVEQLTYLLFLKMADERSQLPRSQPSPIAPGFDWPSLLARDGDALFVGNGTQRCVGTEIPRSSKSGRSGIPYRLCGQSMSAMNTTPFLPLRGYAGWTVGCQRAGTVQIGQTNTMYLTAWR